MTPNPPALPPWLKEKATRLPPGHDDTLDPAEAATDPAARRTPPFSWPLVDASRGPQGTPDGPLAPPPTDPARRALPPSTWPTGRPRAKTRPLRELVVPEPDLDPDIAMWPSTIVSRWPFTGPPAVGIWPKGWLGVDNTATLYVCTVAGQPGTWAAVGSGSSTPAPNLPWVVVQGLDLTGATDNTPIIQAAEAQLPTSGGALAFPPGLVACNWTPSAKTLRIIGMGWTSADRHGTTFLPPPGGLGLTQAVHLLNQCSVETCEINGTAIDSSQATWGLTVDAFNCSTWNVHGDGGSSGCLQTTGNGQRFHLWDSRLDSAALFNGIDGITADSVLSGGSKTFNGGGGIVTGCHLTGNSTGLANVELGGKMYFANCYVDSCDGSAPGLVAHNVGAGQSLFTGCRFYQNSSGNVPVINENTTVTSLQLTGCTVVSSTSSGTFTEVVDAPNSHTVIDALFIEQGAISGNIYGAGQPGFADGVLLVGSGIQTRIPPISYIVGLPVNVVGPLSAGNVVGLFVPILGNMTAELQSVHYVQQIPGATIGADVQLNGVDVPGLNALTVTNTGTSTFASSPPSLNSGDNIHVVLSSPVGGPSGLTFTVQILFTAG